MHSECQKLALCDWNGGKWTGHLLEVSVKDRRTLPAHPWKQTAAKNITEWTKGHWIQHITFATETNAVEARRTHTHREHLRQRDICLSKFRRLLKTFLFCWDSAHHLFLETCWTLIFKIRPAPSPTGFISSNLARFGWKILYLHNHGFL